MRNRQNRDAQYDFGRRGPIAEAPVARKLTLIQRLAALGSGWWGKPDPKKKKSVRSVGIGSGRR